MRVLVLGGNGFIGSHLVDAFLRDGQEVRVFDRTPERYRQPQGTVEYASGNFLDAVALSEALENIDVVVHSLSTTVPSSSNLNPVADIEQNLVGTVHLLELMARMGLKRIVFISSGGTVYGPSDERLIREDHPLRPISSYGIVKVAIEHYLKIFQSQHGVDYVCLRVANPYGPRQGHSGIQGVIGTFLEKLLHDQPIRIWGDGSVVRDYLYISDLAHACVKALHYQGSGTFNIGSGSGESLLEIVEMLSIIRGKPIVPEFLPSRVFDVPRVVLDISRARQALGWQPAVALREGIQHTWQWLNLIASNPRQPYLVHA